LEERHSGGDDPFDIFEFINIISEVFSEEEEDFLIKKKRNRKEHR
jgi:hypothetical protein